ncbi:MAG: hypothetical protein ACQGVC_11815 [Myxococcota bacterium]
MLEFAAQYPTLFTALSGLVGSVLIITSARLKHWVLRREFERRNAAGVEEFSSYEASVRARFLERTVGFLRVLALLAGIYFVALAVASWDGDFS